MNTFYYTAGIHPRAPACRLSSRLMNQAPNAPRVQSYRSRARAAFGISAVFVVPITALFIGGYINRRDAT
jgi:hypothetical protein